MQSIFFAKENDLNRTSAVFFLGPGIVGHYRNKQVMEEIPQTLPISFILVHNSCIVPPR